MKRAFEDSRNADRVAGERVQVATVGIKNRIPGMKLHNGKPLVLGNIITGLICFDLDNCFVRTQSAAGDRKQVRFLTS